MKDQPKTALVTGGAHRVGKSIALALARRGYDLLIHYHRAAAEASASVEEIRALGVRAEAVAADLSTLEGVRTLFAACDQFCSQLEVLVNSAAIMEQIELPDVTEADWDRTIDTNLKGPFFCLQQGAARMPAGGVIINISDIAAHQAWTRYAVHSISKAGVEMLTAVAAAALAPRIRVNAVAPGPVMKPSGMSEERWLEIGRQIPLARPGRPEDVSQAVLFLIDNAFTTGATLMIDGGARLV